MRRYIIISYRAVFKYSNQNWNYRNRSTVGERGQQTLQDGGDCCRYWCDTCKLLTAISDWVSCLRWLNVDNEYVTTTRKLHQRQSVPDKLPRQQLWRMRDRAVATLCNVDCTVVNNRTRCRFIVWKRRANCVRRWKQLFSVYINNFFVVWWRMSHIDQNCITTEHQNERT